MDDAGLDALVDAIRQLHGCAAEWVESVHVIEVYQGGEILWRGDVQVFDVDHPRVRRAYAWSQIEGTRRTVVAVLQLGPVTDAATAVHTSFAQPNHSSGACARLEL